MGRPVLSTRLATHDSNIITRYLAIRVPCAQWFPVAIRQWPVASRQLPFHHQANTERAQSTG
jgi:hypothetical protein